MSQKIASSRTRISALVAGVVSVLSALLVPLAPVVQDVATFSWPVAGSAKPVHLLLYPYQAAELSATFSCSTLAEAARRGGREIVLSTTPDTDAGRRDGLVVELDGSALTITNRGRTVHREQVTGSTCSWQVSATSERTVVSKDGKRVAGADSDVRPHVLGVFSTLDGKVRDLTGLGVRVVSDTRFQTSPSVWKYGLMVLSVLALAVALLALRRIDRESGLPVRRILPRGFWRPRPPDLVVGGVLSAWAFIGALTVDDGYILTMIRAKETSGFVGNYYRWFNAPEAPFDYFYELYHAMTRISDSLLWLRLPSVGLGIVAWLLLSRLVLPRVVKCSPWLVWAAAAVFLAWWLPYNNGIRPEPFIVVGTLGVFCAVERALATRRSLPLAVGLLIAVAAVAITPTGVIAFLPLLTAPRELLGLVRRRLPLLVVLGACGSFGLLLMFYDQTFSAVMEATRARSAIGPSLRWDQEIQRYSRLFEPGYVEGSVARRTPVLLLALSLALVTAVLLRAKRIPGVASGPTRRLLLTTALALAAIALTPTKWTHHFGAFSGLGVAVVVLGVWVLAAPALRSAKARGIALGGVMVVFAIGLSGMNAWWFVSAPDGLWAEQRPNVFGVRLNTVFLVVGLLIALFAVVKAALRGTERPSRLPGPALVAALGCAALVVLQLGTFAAVTGARANTYSVAKQNARSVFGEDCGLASALKIEPKPELGILSLLRGKEELGPFSAQGGYDPAFGPPYLFDRPSTGVPVWGSRVDGDRTTGTATTGWYRVEDSLRRGDAPLVISVAGRLHDGNELAVEFGDSRGRPVRRIVVDEFAMRDFDSDDPTVRRLPTDTPQWRDVRLDVRDAVAGADSIRLVATDGSSGTGGWLAFTPPKAPVLVPMREVVTDTDPTIVDWPVAAVFPCNRPASLALGAVELPRYRIAPGGVTSGLAGMSYAADSAGPFAPVTAVATQTPLPTYLVNDWRRDVVVVHRIEQRHPLGTPAVQLSRVLAPGLSGRGRLNTPGVDDPLTTR
ncbi:arabinosyltransferase domain-containing protein [Allokutzneria sp. NRRL B-24872]|uniref:arabinosyltransferase domain-containing protein n=1 Tax=Allokutzneria sp. NRRL B-24872 TaxID=1137961 RepID=UPI00143DDF68|nr:arabinosyltransferase domain-containing protein [Allokutzneria sp. NRRL B-24872]